jgi:uncharacterized protein YjbI with pentapeptide repeats
MDPIHIEFTIPNLSLFISFGLLVFAIVLYLAISKHRNKLKPLVALLLTPSKYALQLLLFILVPLALIAVYDIYGLITTPEAWEADKRGLAVLLAAIVGAPFVIWRTWIAQKQSATAEQSHMTDRISKAVEQLGAEKTVWEGGEQRTVPNLEVRLGGIYALERIAQDSLRDHIPVMEILCAYVRNNAEKNTKRHWDENIHAENWAEERANKSNIRIDIQTALTVIGRRSPSRVKYERNSKVNSVKQRFALDLHDTNLEWANLEKSDLRFAMLQNSSLIGANFQSAKLDKALFFNAILLGAKMNFSDIHGANFMSAELSEAILVGAKANRESAIFNSARLNGAVLSAGHFKNADFQHCKFYGVELEGSDLEGSNLNDSYFNKFTVVKNCKFRLSFVRLADLSDCTAFEPEQIESMWGDRSTQLNDNLAKPTWANLEFDMWGAIHEWQAAKAAANL